MYICTFCKGSSGIFRYKKTPGIHALFEKSGARELRIDLYFIYFNKESNVLSYFIRKMFTFDTRSLFVIKIDRFWVTKSTPFSFTYFKSHKK